MPTDRVAARVWAERRTCVTVDVPAETELSEPVVVTITGQGGAEPIARQVLVKVGAHAKATVVLRFAGLGRCGPTPSRSWSATAPS